ncbi:MAG: 7TM diverse intracellular signaling domain-containing protein [Cytophagaceae bacterium]
MYRIILILALIFDFSSAEVYCSVILTDGKENFPVINQLFYLEDKSKSLGLQEVLNLNQEFTTCESRPAFGITKSAYWFKFEIQNNSNNDIWFMEISNSYIHLNEAYYIKEDGSIEQIKSESEDKFKFRKIKSNQLAYPVNISKGEKITVYLRFTSKMYLSTNIQLVTIKDFYEHNHIKDIISGLYFGLLIALMIYNLFVYISLRDVTYLFYVIYTFFLGLHISNIKGYGFEYLWPDIPWLNNSTIYVAIATVFAVFFINKFLNVKKNSPLLYKIQFPFAIVSVVALILLTLGYEIEAFFLMAFNPGYIFYVFILGPYIYRTGFKPAIFFVVGFGFLIVEVVRFNLYQFGFLSVNFINEHALEIGSAFEAIMLSYALANKLQFYKKEKEKAQQEALNQAIHFSQQLIESQENERKRVSLELHDSVGQDLIMIKNKILLLKNQETANGKILLADNDLTEMITDSIQEIRNISFGLRPFQLDLLGLSKAIQELIEEISEGGQIEIKSYIDNIDSILSKESEINLYRIIQECLNNIIKHSGAKQAMVKITLSEWKIEIVVEDYGKGLNLANQQGRNSGFGLMGINERVKFLNGSIERGNAFPQGTRVNIIIPIKQVYEKDKYSYSG